MKVLFLAISILFISKLNAQKSPTAPLSIIVENISNSWNDVDQENKAGIILESISAEFTLSKSTTKGGEIKIWILKLGRKVEKSQTSKITLELTRSKKDKSKRKANDSSLELTNFINIALSDFHKLDTSGFLKDLNDKKITIQIGLTIKKNGAGEAAYEIGIFTLSAEGGKEFERANTLTLVFCKDPKKALI